MIENCNATGQAAGLNLYTVHLQSLTQFEVQIVHVDAVSEEDAKRLANDQNPGWDSFSIYKDPS